MEKRNWIKNSLNMPKTAFEMKANLSQKESSWHDKWIADKVYKKVLERNKGGQEFILHDGPPYANGNLHVGHALNKILKDFIVRYHNACGHYAPIIYGWDCHGLPIEHAIAKIEGKKYNELSLIQKREKCRNFAFKNIDNQKQQFKCFGLFTDWDNYYCTMSRDFETRQIQLFAKMLKKKLVYRDNKPIYWSWSSQTALAETEIEYKDVTSPSIYVSFDVVDGKKVLTQKTKLIIWTTTPWTIPSNIAIAVHSDYEYAQVKCSQGIFVVASDLVEDVAKKLGWKKYEIVSKFLGKELEKVIYEHPMYKKQHNIVIIANYVSKDNGTGLVHNAPGHGNEDYFACKKYNIPVKCYIDKLGRFAEDFHDKNLRGVFYDDANKIILDNLKASGHLLYQSEFVHTVAVDWRTKKPVIYRATKQWFIDISSIRNNIISSLEKVKFNSQSSKNHMIEMIKNRAEWCISRQRVWGVPIAIIYDENNEPILDEQLIDNIVKILTNEGCDAWFSQSVEYFLTDKYKAKNYNEYSKCLDTMDVWFDSGSSFLLFDKQIDLYLEGNDQYRGWFNSSAIIGTVVSNCAPYKQLISHGMAVDEQKQKMSKSLGNGVDPLDVCKKYGGEILRLWVANSNYADDISISTNILNQTTEIYRRIRNSLFRFCLANLDDFDFTRNKSTAFEEEDIYVLNILDKNIKAINEYYKQYNFMAIIKTVNNFVIDLSSWYFNLIKDCLYCDDKDNVHRRAIQTVIYYILKSHLVLLQPIMPHTTSEAYQFFNADAKKQDIFFENWVGKLDIKFTEVNDKKWEQIFKLKDLVFAAIEQQRNAKVINKSNEADVTIKFNNQYKIEGELLKRIFNVAKVELVNDVNITNPEVVCKKSNYVKCIRCWNYYPSSEIKDDVCPRCQKILAKIK